MSALLEVRDLDKRYRTRHGVIHAVQGVSFDVREKETVALVGESGCGKSTVALSLLHLIEHDGGRVDSKASSSISSRGAKSRRCGAT